MNDQQLEDQINAKGLNAPRITLPEFDKNIRHCEYVKHVSISGQVLRWAVLTTQSGFSVSGRPSCSASSENDHQETGESMALANTRSELWPLMGYELRQRQYNLQRLRELSKVPPKIETPKDIIPRCSICGEPMPAGETMFKYHGYSGPCPKPPLYHPYQQRVISEKKELDEKAQALSTFIGTNEVFPTLHPDEQNRLREQYELMWQYSEILGQRIAAFKN